MIRNLKNRKMNSIILVSLSLVLLVRCDPIPTTTTTTTAPSPSANNDTECFLSKSSDNEQRLLTRINLMKGLKYEWEDKDHKYYFSVCATSDNAANKSDGFIQVNKDNNSTFVLGRLNDVDMEGVENIIRVSYNDGDNYQRACNKSSRSAVIYFVCDKNQAKDSFEMIEENNAKEKGCAYIFELKTSKICNDSSSTTTTTTTTSSTPTTTANSNTTQMPTSSTVSSSTTASTTSASAEPSKKSTSKLGVISIILISVAAVLVTYMMVGTLYLRIVNQARGWEQIPHLEMWRSIGDRFTTCCNYVCRCGQRQAEVHSYENINDRISDDENLLNM